MFGEFISAIAGDSASEGDEVHSWLTALFIPCVITCGAAPHPMRHMPECRMWKWRREAAGRMKQLPGVIHEHSRLFRGGTGAPDTLHAFCSCSGASSAFVCTMDEYDMINSAGALSIHSAEM